MTSTSPLARVIAALERHRITYMVTGSVASSHHGRPRTTYDVDVVIDPSEPALVGFVRELAGAGFYVDERVALEALRRRRMFNAIFVDDASKIDLIVVKDRDFSREELARRREADLPDGVRARIASPEDTILSKLEWAKRGGGSQRQIEDARGVLHLNRSRIDHAYVARWAKELGVEDLWLELLGRGSD